MWPLKKMTCLAYTHQLMILRLEHLCWTLMTGLTGNLFVVCSEAKRVFFEISV